MATDFVPTRASLLKKNAAANYEQVDFTSRKAKTKIPIESLHKEVSNISQELAFNLQKAKHEVVKFGMSGFNSVKKEEAKIQQLIKLGAKPPKNKCKNYKELLMDKKIQKDKEKKEQTLQQLGKNKVGKSTAKGKSFDRKRRRRKENILDIYGKISKETATLQ
ncbi:uncharacterized protein C1orf131 homolog [Euwallacea similis]|uniref:uncharacterized protein C1orf131 homolog n=1 Tax=Euwallacea similis TaxID=1736056 RepID=UPI00344FEC89